MSWRNNTVNERKQFAFDLNLEPLDDDNSGFPENSDPCTICQEPLVGTNNDHPELVTLKCDHKFHLAFNANGLMQCPNCMQIEPGQWRYGPNHPIQDLSDEDRIIEDLSDKVHTMLCVPSYGSDSSMGTAPMSSFHSGSSSVANAPVPPPYSYISTVQPNQVPSLFGDSSASASCGYMFSSGPEQVARGMSDSWPILSNSNQVNNNGFNRLNALEGQPFSELVEQFEIERQTLLYSGCRGGSRSAEAEAEAAVVDGGSDGNGGGDGGSSSDGGRGGGSDGSPM